MSPRFLADENIDPDLVLGLRRVGDDIDIVRVQDVDLRTQDDPTILDWCARESRILLTHDISTMPDFAHERVAAGLVMPGVFIIRTGLPMARAIDDIATMAGASDSDEWKNRVVYLPLR